MTVPAIWLRRMVHGRSRTSYKLFASFALLVFAIAVVIGFVTYDFFSAKYREKLEDITGKVLENVKKNIDLSVVEKVEIIGTDLGMTTDRNESIQRFLKESTESHQLIILSIYNTLSDIIAMHAGMLESIAIYSHINRTAVSNTTVTFLSNSGERSTPRDISWIRYFREISPSRSWVGPETVPSYEGTDRNNVETVSYVSSLPYFSQGSSRKGLLVVRVRLSFLQSLLERSSIPDAGEIYVLDSSGKVIVSTGAGVEIPADILQSLLAGNGTGKHACSIGKGDENYFLQVESSDINGWKYAIVVPGSLLARQSSVLRGTLFLICILAAFLFLPVGYVVVMAIFDPVNKLLSLLRRFHETSHSDKNIIPDRILIREMGRYFEKNVESYDRIIREHGDVVLNDIVKNALDGFAIEEKEIRSRLKLLHLEFQNPFLFTVVVAVNRPSTGVERGFPELLHRRLIALINRIDIPGMAFYAVSHRRKLIVIVNTVEMGHSSASRLLMEIVENFANVEKLDDYFCGIGSIHEKLSEINISFQDAAESAQEYFLYYTEGHVFEHTAPRSRLDRQYVLSDGELAGYGALIRNGDRAGLEKKLFTLLQDMRREGITSRKCEAVLDTILLKVSDATFGLGYSLDSILGYDAIRYSLTMNRADLRVRWYLEIADRLVEKRSDLDGNGFIEKIKTYIRKNISYELSLQMVADEMAVSYSYLSDLFRKHAGTTFINFVTRTRMEMAEELLRTTRLSVNQISAKIGYANPSYFIKKFKEFAGVSPVRYRRLKLCLERS